MFIASLDVYVSDLKCPLLTEPLRWRICFHKCTKHQTKQKEVFTSKSCKITMRDFDIAALYYYLTLSGKESGSYF